jgi:hypothetical protein
MFFFGLVFTMPDLSRAGNELFYHVNIFKDRGGPLLARFGMQETYNPLNTELAAEQLIYDYIPYAIAGVIIIAFYAFLAVLLVRIAINVAKITFFASKVVNQKIKVTQKREEYRRQLDDLGIIYQNLAEQIGEFTILPADYKNLRAADMIFRFFANNRVDNIREAVNLFHEEDFRIKMLEYERGVYNETRQTRRYTKALYMLTSDENIKVDVKDVREEPAESDTTKVGEMLKDAFSKIKRSSAQKQIPASSPPPLSLPLNPFRKKNKQEQEENDHGGRFMPDTALISDNSDDIGEAGNSDILEDTEIAGGGDDDSEDNQDREFGQLSAIFDDDPEHDD